LVAVHSVFGSQGLELGAVAFAFLVQLGA